VKIATWNVNSVKARLSHLETYLTDAKPDVLCLQELKTEEFPATSIAALGYNIEYCGQKTYNGVALLSPHPISVTQRGLAGEDEDLQARYIEADIQGIRVASIYLPNGNPVDTEKYPYKLRWMARLKERAKQLLATEVPFVLAGDFNIIPENRDARRPEQWVNDALALPQSRAAFRAILNLGLTDAFRALHPDRTHAYSFWDYQAGAWPQDNGIRIDHLLLSPALADRLTACDIDKTPRGWEKASDHTPVWCEVA
jgi:exodeoxyribonuclease-3